MANLELQVKKTEVGLFIVAYSYNKAPLDVQEAAFAANNLDMISPAQLGFLRAEGDKDAFNPYSRTSAYVLYIDNRVVVVPDEAISKRVVADLVGAHRQGREYVVPKNQRDSVYAVADEMLRKGAAFTARHGQTMVGTSEFGQTESTSKLFSDEGFGIKAQKYGDWLKEQGRNTQSMFFDTADYAKSQKGPYLTRLRVYGPLDDFSVLGNYGYLDGNYGAFGVRFEKAAEGGAKK